MMSRLFSAVVAMAIMFIAGCTDKTERQLDGFISNHVDRVRPVMKEANLLAWQAAVTGKAEDYDRAGKLTLDIRRIYSDSNDFDFLKDTGQSGRIKDAMLARQLTVLYNAYLANQIEPDLLKQIVDLSTKIERDFSIHRGTIDGRKVTDNEIKQILKTETDS